MPNGDNTNPLTERQQEILELVARGATNKEIARALEISEHTVRKHLQNIFEKLEVSSRTEATTRAFQEGWVILPTPASATSRPQMATLEPTPARLHLDRRLLAGAGVLVAAVAVWFLLTPRIWTPSPGPEPIPESPNRWTEAAPLPVARAGLAAVVHGGRIYAIAGESRDGVTGLVTRFDPATDHWVPVSEKPTPVRDVGAVVIGGRVYVPGGCRGDGSPTDVLEIYDPALDAWSAGPSMPRPLCAYAIAALEGNLYVFGGWDGSDYVDTVLAYDPEQQRWAARAPMPTARGYAGAAAIEDQIYVVGGYDGRRDLAAVEAYAPARDSGQAKPWTVRAPLPEGRAAPGVVALQSKLYVIGGGWERGRATAEQYDALTDRWSPFRSATRELWRNMAIVTVDTLTETRIYAIGGWDGDFVAATRVYTALYNVILPLQQR